MLDHLRERHIAAEEAVLGSRLAEELVGRVPGIAAITQTSRMRQQVKHGHGRVLLDEDGLILADVAVDFGLGEAGDVA